MVSNTITREKQNDTISNGGAGDDSIGSRGSQVKINAGAGKNTISSNGNSVTITGGNGNDNIVNGGSSVNINAGSDNDTVTNSGSNVSIEGGKGKDSIFNEGDNVSISGGEGKDYIMVDGLNVTVAGGEGNDRVMRGAEGINTAYVYTAGNDTLDNFGYVNAIVLDSVKVSSSVRSGDTVKLNLSNKNSLTLINYRSTKVNLVTSTKKIQKTTSTYNDESETVIFGTKSNDYICNEGDSVTVDAGAGHDYILNVGTNDVSVAGGAGNDFIFNVGEDVSINGGEGHDFIFNVGENATITGGKGNDLLWGSDNADTYLYADGDGRDTIYGFDNFDILQITGKFTATYSEQKDEIYFKVGSTSNALTLKNFAATSFNVNGTSYQISGSKLK